MSRGFILGLSPFFAARVGVANEAVSQWFQPWTAVLTTQNLFHAIANGIIEGIRKAKSAFGSTKYMTCQNLKLGT